MAKSNAQGRSTGILPPFIAVLKTTCREPAWLALPYGARCLYIALKSLYNGQNNGQFFYGIRTAARDLGADKSSTHRWFHLLMDHGFIRMTKAGALGLDGEGSAPYWRLTEVGYMGQQATREYKKWQPVPKTKARTDNSDKVYGKSTRPRTENPDMCTENPDGIRPFSSPARTGNPDISISTMQGGVPETLPHAVQRSSSPPRTSTEESLKAALDGARRRGANRR